MYMEISDFIAIWGDETHFEVEIQISARMDW